ncbi:MAG: cytidine deaminase [Acidimicrobiales bacterium]
MTGEQIDWPSLRRAAASAAGRASAPYSGLGVGAAGLATDGRIIESCNVESASFGLTLCAECGVISALHAGSAGGIGGDSTGTGAGGTGGGDKAGSRPELLAVSCVSDQGPILTPCGRCRQLLSENGGPGLLVDSASGPVAISELLPGAFGAKDLPRAGREPGS